MPRAALLAPLLLLAPGLLGCSGGGEDVQAYCRLVEENRSSLVAVPDDPTTIDEAAATMKELAEAAPSAVYEDWEVVEEAFGDYKAAVAESGYTPDRLGELMQTPERLDADKVENLESAIAEVEEEFPAERLDRVGEAITRYTLQECGAEPFAGA